MARKSRTVFPDTWPISPVCDMCALPDLQPGAFVSQLWKHRPARRGEEGIGVIPPLNEPLIESPVFVAPRVLGPISLVFALQRFVTSTLGTQDGDEGVNEDCGVPNDLLLAASLAFSLASRG